MSDMEGCTFDEMVKCQQEHCDLEGSVMGLMRTLTLSRKRKLLDVIVKWCQGK